MRNTFETDEEGRLLLRCVRAYVEMDILASFEVHTDDTIKYGRKMIDKFAKLANVSHPPPLGGISLLICSDD